MKFREIIYGNCDLVSMQSFGKRGSDKKLQVKIMFQPPSYFRKHRLWRAWWVDCTACRRRIHAFPDKFLVSWTLCWKPPSDWQRRPSWCFSWTFWTYRYFLEWPGLACPWSMVLNRLYHWNIAATWRSRYSTGCPGSNSPLPSLSQASSSH